jgi:ATP synthase protein I
MIENSRQGVDIQAAGVLQANGLAAKASSAGQFHSGVDAHSGSERSGSQADVDGCDESEIRMITASEARRIEAAQPAVTLWQLFRVQLVVSAGLLLLLSMLPGWSWLVAGSAGSLVGLVPAFVAAIVWSRRPAQSPAQALLGLMAWELAKIVLSVALLVLIVLVVPGLNWLGLLLGMIVSMKAGWVYLLFGRKTLAFSKNQ